MYNDFNKKYVIRENLYYDFLKNVLVCLKMVFEILFLGFGGEIDIYFCKYSF